MRHALLAAALLLTACDQVFIEASVPSLCQKLTGQTFHIPPELRAHYAALPADAGVAISKSFAFDVGLQLPTELQGLEAHFALDSVKLTAVAPTTDFGFLESASITLEAADGGALAPATLAYRRAVAAPTTIEIDAGALDLAPYLASGTLAYTLDLLGTLPPADVSADLEVCASASVRLNYLQQR